MQRVLLITMALITCFSANVLAEEWSGRQGLVEWGYTTSSTDKAGFGNASGDFWGLGYRFEQRWSATLQRRYFGGWGTENPLTGQQAQVNANGWAVGVDWHVPVTAYLDLLVRNSALQWSAEATAFGSSLGTRNGTGHIFGLAAQFNVTPTVALTVSAERVADIDGAVVTGYLGSLLYRF